MSRRESLQGLLKRAAELDKQGKPEKARELRRKAWRRVRAALRSQTGVN